MNNNYASLEIEETQNGWVVTTSYFCYGTDATHVFTAWKDVLDFVSEAMRQKNCGGAK